MIQTSVDLCSAESLHRTGRLAEAEAHCRRLLGLEPNNADAAQLLGVVCLQTGRLDEAVERLRAALRLRPEWAEAYNNLGVALEQREQLLKAENAFGAAVRLKPDYPQARINLVNILRRQGRLAEAEREYSAAAALAPGDGAPHGGLGAACLEQGRLKEGIAHYRRAAELLPASAAAHSDLLFWLLHDPDVPPQALFDEHRRWSHRFERPPRARSDVVAFGSDRDPDRPLRVGYVSGDFREHTVARFIEPVLANHDRSHVIAVCYSDVVRPDDVTARLRGYSAEWRDTAGLPTEALAALIRSDRIDLLVDLTGHMGGNRLLAFARRAAPVQATYMAYPHSTGLEAMDWRVTDAVCDEPGVTERYHTERLLRLSGCAFCYQPTEAPPVTQPPAAVHRGAVTFGMLNRPAKVTPAGVALWARVLDAVPRSRLVVLSPGGEDNVRLRRQFEAAGIDGCRLSLLPGGPRMRYLALASEVDVLLDPFPYNGMTTTCDFLWMGVPTVTLLGNTCVSRTGASILRAAGLAELVAGTPEEYVNIAAALAADVPRLAALRASLRDRLAASRLLDGAAVTAELDAAYRQMWRRASRS